MNLTSLLAAFGGIEPIDGDEFTPMSFQELHAIEEELGVRFPESYRSYLTTYGASGPKEIVYYSPINRLPHEISTSGKGHVAVFYGTKSNIDDAYSLERRMRFFSGRIPANLIPVADKFALEIAWSSLM